jgi:hypothetical protein
MKRGPKPIGETVMTHAERQARYRGAHADGAPKVKYRKPADRRSRPQRWRDAVADWWSCKPIIRRGSTRCRKIWWTARRRRRCGQSASLICRSLRSSRHAVSGGTDCATTGAPRSMKMGNTCFAVAL